MVRIQSSWRLPGYTTPLCFMADAIIIKNHYIISIIISQYPPPVLTLCLDPLTPRRNSLISSSINPVTLPINFPSFSRQFNLRFRHLLLCALLFSGKQKGHRLTVSSLYLQSQLSHFLTIKKRRGGRASFGNSVCLKANIVIRLIPGYPIHPQQRNDFNSYQHHTIISKFVKLYQYHKMPILSNHMRNLYAVRFLVPWYH